MNWKQIGRFIRTIFLLRVGLITLVVLAALGPIALFIFEKLLGNLFDLRVPSSTRTFNGFPVVDVAWTAWSLFTVSFAAFMLAWTAVSVINLVIYYGDDRFDDPQLSLDQKRPLVTFFSGLAAALVLVACAALQTPFEAGWTRMLRYLMPALALLCSLVLVVLAKVLQLALTDPSTTPHPPPYLVFPAYIFAPLERRFDALYCWRWGRMNRFKEGFNRIVQWPLEILRCAGQGYLINCEAQPGDLALRSGHVFGLALSFIALAVYLIIGHAKGKIDASPSLVPALAFVLLFFIVVCWFLGTLTFFFDRYRFPLLASLVLLSLATTFAPESDHIYRVEQNHPIRFLKTPSQVVGEHSTNGGKRLVLITAAGGGIQAAAWTAQVLRGLEEACEKPDSGAPCDFRDSVVLISGVSGGSVGAMAYVRSLTADPFPGDRDQIPLKAESSAIDEVAWAWTNPDVFRVLLPWFRRQYIDRGWALEEKWSWIFHLRDAKTGEDTFLADWTPSKSIPAILLNATVVESGHPIVFSNTTFPGPKDPRGLINFYDLYPDLHRNYDIRVNTAARMSASFPFVAPAARSNAVNSAISDYHLVDGGYYDNFGVNSMLGWMEDAIEAGDVREDQRAATQEKVKSAFKDVLVVQIRPFSPGGPKSPRVHGWGFQLTAPIDALLDVRDSGQSAQDQTELAQFTRSYGSSGIHVWRADFVFPSDFGDDKGCAEAPLSWKLSLDQMQCVGKGWRNLPKGVTGSSILNRDISCVVNYLRGLPIEEYQADRHDTNKAYCRTGDSPNPELSQ